MIALVFAALFTSTAQVESLASDGWTLWAATAGGVEEYDLASGARRRLYTTENGLDSNHARSVELSAASVRVRTDASECWLGAGHSFRCAAAAQAGPPAARAAPLYEGARETARLDSAGHRIVGTANGLWLDGRRITPDGQICGNHVEALVEFRGAVWAGGFDGGLCVLENGRFRSVRAPFRMVNDLHVTARGLWVAAAEGLWFSADGRSFRREARVRERGVNRIAASAKWLFVTTPVALYALRLDNPDVVRRFWRPAGSTALQSVAVSGANVWLASEDAGVIRMRGGKFEAFDRASGLPSSWAVDVAAAPGGGVWVATLRDGAVRLDGHGKLVGSLGDPRAWGLRLYDDGGRILFGTQQGIEGISGLPDPHAHALLRTRDGLWIGTEGGLVLLENRGHDT